MNKEWINKIIFRDENERNTLVTWCENIGYSRYEEFYDFASKYIIGDVDYDIIKSIAKYDFCLSDMVHSMLKFFELRIRSYIENMYGYLKITKENYLYVIAEEFTQGKKKLACDTYYDGKLNKECMLKDFLYESSIETLLRILFVLEDEKIKAFSERSNIYDECFYIKELRNHVAHGKILVGRKIVYKKKSKLVRDIILNLFEYMPTEAVRKKRIEELKSYNEKLDSLPDTLKLAIIIKKD